MVAPFENASSAPGLEWIGEAFPEVLGQRLASPTTYVMSREDRLNAFDRSGIPADLHPPRATLFRIAEQMDADFVVLGRYTFDGRLFTATAQLLNIRDYRLSPEISESGPLPDLINLQTALAWDLLRQLHPGFPATRPVFLTSAPPLRLDSLENYVRGITAVSPQEKLRYFREAIRINPNYNDAILALGKTYMEQHEYEPAVSWLARVPHSDPAAGQAQFFLGLASYDAGRFDHAEAAFSFLAERLPLTEVYNNLGVVAARRGKKSAADYFQKAVQADPGEADYHFNLGVALYRAGDPAASGRQVREALSLHPDDPEARALLDTMTAEALQRVQPDRAASAGKVPLERIKRHYDENSFRQLAWQIQAVAEQRLLKTDPRSHAQFHGTRGADLLNRGFVSEAEKEYRDALTLDPSNAEAQAGLAHALESRNDLAGARQAADAALRLKPSAEALLVLVRLDLRDNRVDEAVLSLDRALELDRSNAAALALKRVIAAKLAEKAQPLQKP